MASSGQQVRSGKAFEFAIAYQFFCFLKRKGIEVELVTNKALTIAKGYYNSFKEDEKLRFDSAAYNTIDTIRRIEPGLVAKPENNDALKISLKEDHAGANCDVRDIIFKRCDPYWEIGISAKNNNDAVKHSRLGRELDFGAVWVNDKCSDRYWEEIAPIFTYL